MGLKVEELPLAGTASVPQAVAVLDGSVYSVSSGGVVVAVEMTVGVLEVEMGGQEAVPVSVAGELVLGANKPTGESDSSSFVWRLIAFSKLTLMKSLKDGEMRFSRR